MIGVMLLGMFSCKNAPTLQEPIQMYAVNQAFNEATVGRKHLNYKLKKKYVGEWVSQEELKFIPLNEAPNTMMCFNMKDWLEVVRPKLKQASHYYQQKFKR